MCAVALHRRAPLPPDATEGVELSIDVAEPAARHRSRPSQRACEAYDQEAERPLGRRWVKDQMSEGMACQLNDALVSTNLGQLPPRDTIFALSDGERTLGFSGPDGALPLPRILTLTLTMTRTRTRNNPTMRFQ